MHPKKVKWPDNGVRLDPKSSTYCHIRLRFRIFAVLVLEPFSIFLDAFYEEKVPVNYWQH